VFKYDWQNTELYRAWSDGDGDEDKDVEVDRYIPWRCTRNTKAKAGTRHKQIDETTSFGPTAT
jgi:hypothetical protein